MIYISQYSQRVNLPNVIREGVNMPNVISLLENNVVLEYDCLDRIFLNGYLPDLQTASQLSWFLTGHLSNEIPRYSVLGEKTRSFIKETEKIAKDNKIPIIHFEKHTRKEAIAKPYFNTAKSEGMVLIGISQEKSNTFRPIGKKEREPGKYSVTRASSYVNHYYFYILDNEFGPTFIKICSYAPFSIRVWLNGHEWLKKQLLKENIAYEELDNGIFSCDSPTRLQEIADSLLSTNIQSYFNKWINRIPLPLTQYDREKGYTYNLSIMQLEISKTQVFDRPIHGRQFFESVIKDNLDLGRPEKMQIIFHKRIPKYNNNKREIFRTRIFTQDTIPSIHIEHKRTSLKQYFKCGKALRTETTINDARYFQVGKLLVNLNSLREIGKNINNNLIQMETAENCCTPSAATFESMIQPTKDQNNRAPGLHFGDPRVVSVFAALCNFKFLISGITNKELRPLVENHLGKTYTTRQMSYDLRRLKRKQLIRRIPNTNKYEITENGRKMIIFNTIMYQRVICKTLAMTLSPYDRSKIATTWRHFDNEIKSHIQSLNIAA